MKKERVTIPYSAPMAVTKTLPPRSCSFPTCRGVDGKLMA